MLLTAVAEGDGLPDPGLSTGVYTVLVALIVSVIAPLVLSTVQSRARRAERREDISLRKEIATQAAEAADLVLIQNEALSTEIINTVQSKVPGVLSEIDVTLSTDDLLNARVIELKALEAALISSAVVFRINKARDISFNPNDLAFPGLIRDRIAELRMRMIIGEYDSQGDDNGTE